jgi:hypothetical protein
MKERINITPDKKKIIKSIKELEFEYSQNKISRREYLAQKKVLEHEIENFNAADRIKRLQGKGQSEKPLEYWTEKEEQVKQKEEKEKLLKQFVTTPPKTQRRVSGTKFKTFLGVFLVAAFFVGTAFGAVLLKPTDTSGISMAVNDSAFPVVKNNTTANGTITSQSTSNSTVKTTTTKQTTTTTKPTTTQTTTKPTGNST